MLWEFRKNVKLPVLAVALRYERCQTRLSRLMLGMGPWDGPSGEMWTEQPESCEV